MYAGNVAAKEVLVPHDDLEDILEGLLDSFEISLSDSTGWWRDGMTVEEISIAFIENELTDRPQDNRCTNAIGFFRSRNLDRNFFSRDNFFRPLNQSQQPWQQKALEIELQERFKLPKVATSAIDAPIVSWGAVVGIILGVTLILISGSFELSIFGVLLIIFSILLVIHAPGVFLEVCSEKTSMWFKKFVHAHYAAIRGDSTYNPNEVSAIVLSNLREVSGDRVSLTTKVFFA